jgi:hypothetical protein
LTDPLEVNALLVSQGRRRCLLLSFDLLFIGGELERQIRSALAAGQGLADQEIFLFASHTHFAPPTDESLPRLGPYDAGYAARIVTTVIELAAELQTRPPRACRLEVKQGKLDHSINRRLPRRLPLYTRSQGVSFQRVIFGPNPKGPRDETATFVWLVDTLTGERMAALWHYACHPVGRVPREVISADFPGAGRKAIRAACRAELPVLFLQGFCGDIRPNIVADKATGLRKRLRNLVRAAIGGVVPMEYGSTAWSSWVTTLSRTIGDLAMATPDSVEDLGPIFAACASVPIGEFFAGRLRNDTAMRVCALRLAKRLELLALGAEPCLDWLHVVTAELGAADGIRLHVGYCGDVFGYLPLPEQVDEGGYEVDGFQPLFSMSGRFRKETLRAAVTGAAVAVAREAFGSRTS